MKIIADSNIPLAQEAFAQFGEVTTLPGRKITRDSLDGASMLLVRSMTKVNAQLLDGTDIRFVGSAVIGTDHIDLDYLRNNQIAFAGAPGSNALSVAEYVASALVHISSRRRWNLADKTLGIVGVGNVGSKVLKLASALGVTCLINDPPKKKVTGSEMFVDLDQLISQADIVSFHVPLTRDGPHATVKMANEAFFEKLKQGTILINTSRGQVVDESMLRKHRDRLGACILDVWENEPSINLETLALADIATPHIAGHSREGKVRGTQMLYDAACAFFFKEKKYLFEDVLPKQESKTVRVDKPTHESVYEAIMQAYPVMKDDEKMRKITGKEKKEQPVYFDSMRESYSRGEFGSFKLECRKGIPARYIEALRSLGFLPRMID